LQRRARRYVLFRKFLEKPNGGRSVGRGSEGPLVIFDCNGVLVDSEPIAAAVLADAFERIGIAISADTVMRRFQGRRPADIFAAVETATNRRIPPTFPGEVAAATLRRLRTDLRPIAHAAYALTWIRGPKAVASSSSPERIRLSLEVTGLIRFFEARLFSAANVYKGKPAPDVFLLAAARSQVEPSQCVVVEDSAPGVTAAVAAGMTPIGFVGGSQTPGRLATELLARGARIVVADMRALKSAITDLRGW
jgi:HAD superfamily hydrolase (TIGR01509 family)